MIGAGYILQLILMLALVAGMAVGALWLWRKAQPGLGFGGRQRYVKVVDAVPMGGTSRLAVVEFDERHLLIAVSRGQITLLADGPAPLLVPADDADA
ncbi:flagellar biosynthetic protein FliO [Sphingomonas montana]|uniref:flagellar biosynthetic protein FliO n=1 Tax=Sphingomonas montana TaxID=1843236 RepID=UPI00096BF6C5